MNRALEERTNELTRAYIHGNHRKTATQVENTKNTPLLPNDPCLEMLTSLRTLYNQTENIQNTLDNIPSPSVKTPKKIKVDLNDFTPTKTPTKEFVNMKEPLVPPSNVIEIVDDEVNFLLMVSFKIDQRM